MPYRFLCNDIQREIVKPRLGLTSELFCYVPLHKIRYGIHEVEKGEIIRSNFYLKRTDAFISKDKVSIYLFDQGQANKVMDEDGVIELNTFGLVSDHISEIYFNL